MCFDERNSHIQAHHKCKQELATAVHSILRHEAKVRIRQEIDLRIETQTRNVELQNYASDLQHDRDDLDRRVVLIEGQVAALEAETTESQGETVGLREAFLSKTAQWETERTRLTAEKERAEQALHGLRNARFRLQEANDRLEDELAASQSKTRKADNEAEATQRTLQAVEG